MAGGGWDVGLDWDGGVKNVRLQKPVIVEGKLHNTFLNKFVHIEKTFRLATNVFICSMDYRVI